MHYVYYITYEVYNVNSPGFLFLDKKGRIIAISRQNDSARTDPGFTI